MRKLAFIPTREAKERPIKTFLEKAGWEVHYLVNESSIFEAYTKAFKDNNIIAKDKIIMCHDDIQILNTPEMFNEVVDNNLTKDVGFLGIAGPQRLNKTSCWWHGLGREYPHPDSFLRGCVWHGDSLDECFPTYYGGYGEAEVLDGLLLITTGATLNNIKTAKPKEFSSDWDYYDMYYTLQANRKGRKNHVVPLMVLHSSEGEGAMSEEWNESRLAFHKMYGDSFLEITLPDQSQLPKPE
jgi:hypothetical protein